MTLCQGSCLERAISAGHDFQMAMVDVFEFQELGAEQATARDAVPPAHVALTLYFLAGIALQLVFGNQNYGTGTVTWFPLTGLAIIAVYSSGWLAVPLLFCASVIGSALAGTLFVSPQTVLSEAGVTVSCCAIGALVLRRLGRAGSLTMKV